MGMEQIGIDRRQMVANAAPARPAEQARDRDQRRLDALIPEAVLGSGPVGEVGDGDLDPGPPGPDRVLGEQRLRPSQLSESMRT